MENKHYICLGECEGVSNNPGVCQASECNRHGQALVECYCTDGDHRLAHDNVDNEVEE